MALVDYDYKFLAIDAGAQGRISDGGVFKNSAMENNTLKLPPPSPLPLLNDDFYNTEERTLLPFVFFLPLCFSANKILHETLWS